MGKTINNYFKKPLFKNNGCDEIYKSVLALYNEIQYIRENNPNLVEKTGRGLEWEQLIVSEIRKGLEKIEIKIDMDSSLDQAFNVCAKNDILCVNRKTYYDMENELKELREKLGRVPEPNDDQQDVSEFSKKVLESLKQPGVFVPLKENNDLKDFQQKLLEMITMRQQDVIDKLPTNDNRIEIGQLKAYKDIFELVLAFYRCEKEKQK